MRLSRVEQLLAGQNDTAAQINEQVDLVEARVKAGTDRLTALREIKLLALDIEIEINRLTAKRDQLLEGLNIEYGLNDADAKHIIDTYLANRPEELAWRADAASTGAWHCRAGYFIGHGTAV